MIEKDPCENCIIKMICNKAMYDFSMCNDKFSYVMKNKPQHLRNIPNTIKSIIERKYNRICKQKTHVKNV